MEICFNVLEQIHQETGQSGILPEKNPWFLRVFNITHRIHGAGIYANIWGILMVNVTIYGIHGSYGLGEGEDYTI